MTQAQALTILKMGKNVFLTGPAGSGKTYVLNQYIELLKDHGVDVAVTASTGIAATHLKGMTIHAWSGIGVKETLTDYDMDQLEQRAYLWKRFEKTKVLIIDEISMLSARTLDTIDAVSKLFKRSSEPFGGMQVIFCGDFFQLPPIEKKSYQEEQTLFVDEHESPNIPFAFTSKAWKTCDLHICYLAEQYRQQDDVLLGILADIRSGEVSQQTSEYLRTRLLPDESIDIPKLYTHNINVDTYNQQKLKELKTQPEKTYTMTSHGKPPMVAALKRSCMAPETLSIKPHALVMFVKNNPVAGYVNGTVGEVVAFEDGFPVIETKTGERFVATPQKWAIEDGDTVLAEIEQVPLRLAWAVTIHKSQGMTLDKAVIDLSHAFVHGQGYVALSRVKQLTGIFLKGFNEIALRVHDEVLAIDAELRHLSDSLRIYVEQQVDAVYKQQHEAFFEKIGAKKYAVRTPAGDTQRTYDITATLLKEKKTIKEITDIRGIKSATVITHIEKLLDEGVLRLDDIAHLNPNTERYTTLIDAITVLCAEDVQHTLTSLFHALDGQYSFDDIRFARLFCVRKNPNV